MIMGKGSNIMGNGSLIVGNRPNILGRTVPEKSALLKYVLLDELANQEGIRANRSSCQFQTISRKFEETIFDPNGSNESKRKT